MKGGLLITTLIGAGIFSILWTIWYLFGHLTGRAVHLEGDRLAAYKWQLKGYKFERRGDLRAAADAYSRSLELDPTNHELEARLERLRELIDEDDETGQYDRYTT